MLHFSELDCTDTKMCDEKIEERRTKEEMSVNGMEWVSLACIVVALHSALNTG